MSAHVGSRLRLSASRIRIGQSWSHSQTHQRHDPHSPSRNVCFQIPGSRRHFGFSDAVGGLLKGSDLLITNMHNLTGTPWYISIPLVALAVNATIRAPLTVYSRRSAVKKAKLIPILQAQSAIVAQGLKRKAVSNIRARIAQAVKQRSKVLFRSLAINERKSLLGGLLGFPVFWSNLEVIRRMCGGPRGLLGGLVYGFVRPGADAAGQSLSSSSVAAPTDLSDAAVASAQNSLTSVHLGLEPSFATGGCLWFPDLLVPDPLHILPFATSVLLVASLMPENMAGKRLLLGMRQPGSHGIVLNQSRGKLVFLRSMLVVALAIGPLTMDLPAAVHLYWVSSVGCSLAVSRILRKTMPIPKETVKPCIGYELPFLRPKPK